jgi:N-dimethylarginine dimethylaminohydrolase
MDASTMSEKELQLVFIEKNQVNKSHFADDMPAVWGGKWYVDSEIGRLRKVLMRRPGKEIENLRGDPREWSLCGPLNPEAMREEHDALVKIYRDNGVEVYLIDDEDVPENVPNILFCRDIVNGSPCGAIISRMGVSVRSPEVRPAAMKLGKLGVPIAKTINGTGTFEGACLIWIDRETVLLGKGTRSNEAGVRQMEDELRNQGVKELIRVDLPHNDIHLDGMLAIADYDLVLMNLDVIPEHVYLTFKKRGFRILEIPKEEICLAANFVAIEPGKIVICGGCPKTKRLLENAHVECIETSVNNIRVAAGAIHCMTAFLEREPVRTYDVKEL